jgi:large subunit ribosomal protein L24
MHIKTNDTVEVIAGDDKGERGKVLSIDRKVGRLIVEGVNRVYKHVRRSPKNPQGGRLSKEMPIQVSNVLLLCTRCGKGVRTGARLAKDGSKERYCKKCGTAMGVLSPPKSNPKSK